MKKRWIQYAGACIVLGCALLLTVSCKKDHRVKKGYEKSQFTHYISTQGNALYDGEKKLRFVSFNIPELGMEEEPYWGLIDSFEQEDAIKTIAALGGQVTRCYVFSIRTEGKNSTHLTSPGEFNEECFAAFDNLLRICNEQGVRLIVPFIDTWSHWGGIKEFSAFRNKDLDQFYTDKTLRQDYKNLVHYVLNRVNTRTGVAYKDDPAILAWELGNELRQATDEWTAEMAAYIKSIDKNHLVMDGRDIVSNMDLDIKQIDIISAHYYGNNYAARFKADYALINERKPFIVGEFGLAPDEEMEALIQEVVQSGAAGALIWSLRQHDSQGGFKWHQEGGGSFYAYHWPGFEAGESYSEQKMVNLIRSSAYAVRELPVPPLPKPAGTPVLLPVKSVSDIRWLGVVNAAAYDIERSENPEGPWIIAGSSIPDSVNDPEKMVIKQQPPIGGVTREYTYRIMFQDNTIIPGKTYYYRVKAKNQAGESDYSNVEKVENARITSGIIQAELNIIPGKSALFTVEAPLTAFILTAAYRTEQAERDLQVFVSSDGVTYQEAAYEKEQDNKDPGKSRYFIRNFTGEYRFLKIDFARIKGPVTGAGEIKIGFGRQKPVLPRQRGQNAAMSTIDTFEDYEGNTEALKKQYERNIGGGTVELLLVKNYSLQGSYSLQYSYDLGTPGYAGVTKNFKTPASWSDKEIFQLRYIPDDSGNKLVIQFKEKNGEYWETSREISGNGPTLVTIPFTEFAQPGWGGKVDGILDLDDIAEFSIYVNKIESSRKTAGTLIFDDIQLTRK